MSRYAELLKDPRWQRKRLEILQRDEWTCMSCFSTETTLHVHHRYYVPGKAPWEYPDHSLVTLCAVCHEDETEALREAERIVAQALKIKGADSGQILSIADAFFDLPDTGEVKFGVICWHLKRLFSSYRDNGPEWRALVEEWKKTLEIREGLHRVNRPIAETQK